MKRDGDGGARMNLSWVAAGAFLIVFLLASFAVFAGCPSAAIPFDPDPITIPNDRPCPTQNPGGCECTNSPVYVRAGIPTFSEADLSVGGPGLPLSLTRHYLASSRFVGMVGYAWITPFEERITEETDGSVCRAVLLMKDGTTTAFTENACDWQYGPNDLGYPWTLVFENPDPVNHPEQAHLTLAKEDGTEQVFDDQGRLREIRVGRQVDGVWVGEKLILEYSGTPGHLVRVYDPKRSGREIVFGAPDTQGFVPFAKYGPPGEERAVGYGRNALGDLTQVTRPDGSVVQMGYRALDTDPRHCSQPHLLQSVKEVWAGTEFPETEAQAYDVAGKLSSKTEGGRVTAFTYPGPLRTEEVWDDANGVEQRKTLTIDELGRITGVNRVEICGGYLCPKGTEERVYDPVTGKLTYHQDEGRRTGGDRVWTKTEYDASGNVIKVTRDYCDALDPVVAGCTTSGTHLNLPWEYRYVQIEGEWLVRDVKGPPGFEDTHMEYYASTGGDGVAGKLKETWRVIGRAAIDDPPTAHDVLASYTYFSGAASPAFGQVKSVTTAQGTTTYTYHGIKGSLESVTLPKNSDSGANPVIAYTTNWFHDVTQVTDAEGAVTAMDYDGPGRTARVNPPDPVTGQASAAWGTAFTYNDVAVFWESAGADREVASSRPLLKDTTTDPNGRKTERFKDAFGRVDRVKDAAGHETRYSYYTGGLLKSITDANGNVTNYAYDGLDRLKSVTDPYGNVASYTYYRNGALQSRTDGKGSHVYYRYDNIGRLTEKEYYTGGSRPTQSPIIADPPSGWVSAGVVTFTYSGDRIASVTDEYHKLNNVNQSYAYSYDTRHRLESVTSPTGTVAYTYVADNNDAIASVSDGTKTWSYSYYPDGSLKAITAPEGVYTYTYKLGGQVANVSYPNGSSVAYAYDLQHRLTRIQNWAVPSTSLISQYDYVYDQGAGPDTKPMKGMISSVTEQFKHTDQNPYGPYTTTYGYDPLYQLTSAVYPDFEDTLDVPWDSQIHAWSYDLIGNRTSYTTTNPRPDEPPALYYFYNLANKGPQLEKISPNVDGTNPTTTFSYDPNGNMFTELAGGVTKTYTWDQDDKMTGLSTSDNSASETNVYSFTGDRLRRTLNNITWNYLYSKEDILKVDQGGASPMYLTQGPGIDDVLAKTVVSTTNYTYKNMHSSVMQLADNSGGISNDHLYDSWGMPTHWPALGGDNSPYGYTGRELDSANNYYYRRRTYEPSIAKFLSTDPIADTLDYAYVSNKPIFQNDPFGLSNDWMWPANVGRCKYCGIRTAPRYSVTGTVRGGTDFHWHAEFMNDSTHEPTCCEVRQMIAWDNSFSSPPHSGFTAPDNQPNHWYEDRHHTGIRYGRRTGPYRFSQPGMNWYEGPHYFGADRPYGFPPGSTLRFRLIVVDVCRNGVTIYSSPSITVSF